MIEQYSRVKTTKNWADNLKASPKPFYNQFGKEESFIFFGIIPNDPLMCLVLGETSGKMMVGKLEFFEDPPKSKKVDKLKGMGLLEEHINLEELNLPIIVEMTHEEIIREYYD